MTYDEIKAELQSMVRAMMDKGVAEANARMGIPANYLNSVAVSGKGVSQFGCKFIHGETPAEAIAAAHEFIASIPSRETIAMKTYMAKLADAVDYGHESGIDAQYVDPVRITQKAMTENLIGVQK